MDDYSTEPRLIFTPLSTQQYCQFYAIEMAANQEDFSFYTADCTHSITILELGCGTGRVTHAVAKTGAVSVGLDISDEMLQLAKIDQSGAEFHLADMTRFDLSHSYDRIHIPYNTLNLLSDKEAILSCLQRSQSHLKTGGKLLAQLFVPSENLISKDGEHIFQFQLFDTDDGGKLVKETIRTYNHKEQIVHLEERYRVRPGSTKQPREDVSHTLQFLTPQLNDWQELFASAGFNRFQSYSSPECKQYDPVNTNTVFIIAEKI